MPRTASSIGIRNRFMKSPRKARGAGPSRSGRVANPPARPPNRPPLRSRATGSERAASLLVA